MVKFEARGGLLQNSESDLEAPYVCISLDRSVSQKHFLT